MYLTEVQTDVESRELAASNAPCPNGSDSELPTRRVLRGHTIPHPLLVI